MIHRYFFLLLFICFSSITISQVEAQTISCKTVYQENYKDTGNDEALGVVSLADEGMVVVGRTTSESAGDYDGFIMRLDDNGAVIWRKIIGSIGFDELKQIKITNDSGFIAIGTTKSFTNTNGQPIIVRLDATGNILWSKIFSDQNSGSEIPSALLSLTDGSFAFAVNINTSTVNGDGLVIKIAADGTTVWATKLDNGNDDGLTSLAQNGDTLLVGGYATIQNREAVLTKIDITSGSVFSGLMFADGDQFNISLVNNTCNELIGLENINNNYSLGIIRYPKAYSGDDHICYLTTIRMSPSNNINFQYRYELFTSLGLSIDTVNILLRQTADEGFIFICNDTTLNGNSVVIKTDPYGFPFWGKNFYTLFSNTARIGGMDFSSQGYAFVGFENDYLTANKSQTRFFKTDRVGNTGQCSLNYQFVFEDTSQEVIVPFVWADINDKYIVTDSDVSPSITNNILPALPVCNTFSCDSVFHLEENCKPSFLMNLKTDQNFLSEDVINTSDGGYAVAGYYTGAFSNQPVVIKLDQAGNIKWSKSFGEYYHEGVFTKIKETTNGELIVLGDDVSVVNHEESTRMLLMEIDSNGNVIWQNTYSKYDETSGYDFVIADNGDIITTETDNEATAFAESSFLTRFDSTGNILWSKYLGANSPPFFQLVMLSGNDLYEAGTQAYNNTGIPIVAKFDATTGAVKWIESFYSNNVGLHILSLQNIGDTIFCIVGELGSPNVYNDHIAVIKILNDGTLIGTNEIVDFNIDINSSYNFNNHTPNFFSKTLDSNFVFSQKIFSGNLTMLNVTKFNSNCIVKWSKNFSNIPDPYSYAVKAIGNNVLITGGYYLGTKLNYQEIEGYLLKTDSNGIISQGSMGNCEAFTQITSAPAPLSLNYISNTFTESDDGPLAIDYNAYPNTINLDVIPDCYTNSLCSTFSINGSDSICNSNIINTYQLTRNSGCNATAEWIVDTSKLAIINFNDTVLTVKPLMSGSTIINALVNSGCNVQTISKVITIVPGGNLLSLGPDTILCGTNTIILNAKSSFASYKWQDNSTDSTYIVTIPGKYYVTATDYCGNSFSDTINVLAANFYFSIGDDTAKCNNDTLILQATAGFNDYQWAPIYNLQSVSDSIVKVFPNIDTAYIATAQKWPGCFVSDTVHIQVLHSPSINLGNDTSICSGQSLLLNAGNGFNSYNWNTGAKTQTITANQQSTYSVEATAANGCSSTDTIKLLNVYPLPLFTLGNDTTLCQNQKLTFNFNLPNASYLWNNGSISGIQTINQAGTYWLAITQHSCSSYDTIVVTYKPLPVVQLGNDTTLCEGVTKQLDATNNNATYQWQDGSTNAVYLVQAAGLYYVIADLNGCKASDSIFISYIPKPFINLGNDTFICSGQDIILQPLTNTTVNYLWQDGSKASSFDIKDTGVYTLTVSNLCGSSSSSIEISKGVCELYMPSAFTPNKDGLNDLFRVKYPFTVSDFSFIIYNRWGQKVFETEDISKGWDGTYNGTDQNTGAYVWVISFIDSDNIKKFAKGTVTLIR